MGKLGAKQGLDVSPQAIASGLTIEKTTDVESISKVNQIIETIMVVT